MSTARNWAFRALVTAMGIVLVTTCRPEPFEPEYRIESAQTTGGGQVFVGAGDMANCVNTNDEATADLIDAVLADDPTALVYTAGDNVYEDGTAQEYAQCYEPSWGRFRNKTWATIGNHEYQLGNADPTFDYYGARVGPRDKGYYSVDVGNWHVVMLNSNTSFVPAKAGSPQDTWLRQDLAANTKACVMAIFHHPRFFSSNTAGSSFKSSSVKPFWDALYEYGADVVVVGHTHHYERFAPQDPDGNLDLASGIRQFIVGTGGRSVQTKDFRAPNSEVRNDERAYGVLKFTLHDTSYEWEFLPTPGFTFTDSGSGTCTGSSGSTAPTVTISEPADGSAFNQGTSITFTGTATDAEDGSLTSGLSWTSSLDGSIGSGGSFSKSNLSVGTHSITAAVTDSDGLQGSDAITVSVNAAGANTLDVRVAASSDDAEEGESGSVYIDSSDLELVYDTYQNAFNQTVGMRFNGVGIPRGATVTSAYIQFTVDETGSDATLLTIKGQATDNAATFGSTTGNISSRSRTTSSASWSPAPWPTVGAAGLDQRTPNIASIIQEVVNRAGWSSGNSLAIIITGTGKRTAEAYDGSAAKAPLLRVEYSVGSGPNMAPTATFIDSCTDLDCDLTDESTDPDGTVTAWSWGFGDGQTSTLQNPSHTYAAAGDYTVTLTVTDDDGATSVPASRTVTVTAPPPPNQVPTASFIDSCTDLDCDLTDESTDPDGTVTAWSWSFGDGGTSTLQNPSHAYAAAGDYTVTLTVTDDDGATSVPASRTVTVTAPPPPNQAPTASFTHSCNELTCGFTDTSNDSDGTVTAWSWSFGDGGTSTLQSPSHTYAAAGDYTVKLTVTDDDGATSSPAMQTVSVTAAPPPNQAPTASFTHSCNELTCGFTDTSNDSDGTVTVWSWSFGDGGTSTLQSPSHTYAAAGDYTVKLTVTDDDGATSSPAMQTVSVTAAPPPNQAPTASFTHSCNELTCGFTDTSNDSDGTVTVWSWNFGDGSTSTQRNPSHTYAAAGDFTVTLTVTDDDGAASSPATQLVTVTSTPPANQPPTAADDAGTLATGQTLNVPAPGVLANDSDPEGGALTVTTTPVTTPSHGTLTLGAAGSYSYTHDGTETTSDAFVYEVCDAGGLCDTATVNLTITGVAPSVHVVTPSGSTGYGTSGGKTSDVHLEVTVTLVDGNGAPVANASVAATISGPMSRSFSGTTNASGQVVFKLTNAPSGTYTTTVTSVTAAGLTWDGTTPPNSFTK